MVLKYCLKEGRTECGIDETGYGSLIGSLYTCAVILPPYEYLSNTFLQNIKDSKKIKPEDRNYLRGIIENEVEDYSIGIATKEEIDEMNSYHANMLAMHRALDGLSLEVDHILVDGNRFKPYKNISHTTVVRGDGTYLSIAAASILAKEYRDEYIRELCIKDETLVDRYNVIQNMGYPVHEHTDGIQKYGYSKYHRKSYVVKSITI